MIYNLPDLTTQFSVNDEKVTKVVKELDILLRDNVVYYFMNDKEARVVHFADSVENLYKMDFYESVPY